MSIGDNFCNHLQSIGIVGKKLGEGAIKLTGQNIDLILLSARKTGMGLAPYVYVVYVVSRYHVESWENWLATKRKQPKGWEDEFTMIRKIQEGFLRKKVTGFEWIGLKEKSNRISEILNRDYQLNNYLLSRFQAGMPNITIVPFEKGQVYGISLSNLYSYPTREDIEAFNAIAKHLKEAY